MMLAEKEKNLPEMYKKVLNLIPEGSAKPITVSDISKLTGIGNDSVREIVTKLIITYGYKIGTSNVIKNSGYYMIQTAEEREATVRNLRSRANQILKRARAIEGMASPNQVEMEL